MTKLNRSIRRWGHVSCQLGPSLSGVTFSDQKGNWFLAPHERQRPAHNRALKFTKNTWLPPLCSHLLASPCQSGSQPQPKEMSSRIDKEPRTRISKYLFFRHLPEHIYDRHIEVWGYLDVTLAAGWFQFTVFCLYDKSLKTGNEILREMSWIHLKTFSIISVTSKWMESSKLVFPRPKFFKVFIENLRVVDILSEWVCTLPVLFVIFHLLILIFVLCWLDMKFYLPSLSGPLLARVVDDPISSVVEPQWHNPVWWLWKIFRNRVVQKKMQEH